jgi:hypothetical protein
VRVSAPGHTALELDVVGGAPKLAAALVPKPRVITFKTEPPGALIAIDGNVAGSKLSPQEIELTKQQAAKKSVRIRLYKNGYKAIERTVQASAFTEDDARMIATIDEKLQVQVVVRPPPDRGSGAGSQTGSASAGSGSAAPSGGSSTPPGDPVVTPPAGAGSQGAAPESTGEPAPSFTNPP